MKLYIYDHCPFCTRARMIFAITGAKVTTVILPSDEKETIKMVGKKICPVLEKDDGTFMHESLDIVHYISKLNGSPLKPLQNKEIKEWTEQSWKYLKKLIFPRVIKLGLEEFKNPSAIEFFTKSKEEALGISFEKALEESPKLIEECNQSLKELSPLITKLPSIKNRDFSEDDIFLFSILRLISMVRGVKWEKNVKEYMMHIATITMIPLHDPV